MAYQKTNWVNDNLPAINAENLNKIENGIENSYIFKNLLYMNYSKGSSTTINGVTFTINDDYSITASGTGTAIGYLWLIGDDNTLKLDDNKTYTWSLTTINGLFVDVARIVSKTTTSNLKEVSTSAPKVTFLGSYFNDSIKAFLRVQKDVEYNYTIKLQLEENDEATNPVPFAGYIVESGSNQYGTWTKYSDGTMICASAITRAITFSQSGNSYTGETTTAIFFPQDFIENPRVTINTQHDGDYYYCVVYGFIRNKTSITKITFLRTSSPNAEVNIPFSYIAIGKWK